MDGLQIFLIVGAALLIAAIVIAIVSPRLTVRGPFRVLLGTLYRRRVVGLENLPKEGGCVVVSNHVSWIDGILILWLLPRNVRFVVDGANFNNAFAKSNKRRPTKKYSISFDKFSTANAAT